MHSHMHYIQYLGELQLCYLKSKLLTFRFRGCDFTARDVGAECNRYIGVSGEAPWELTTIRISTVVLPKIPLVHKRKFNYIDITHGAISEHMLNRLGKKSKHVLQKKLNLVTMTLANSLEEKTLM